MGNSWAGLKILNKNPLHRLPSFVLLKVANRIEEQLDAENNGDLRTKKERYLRQIDSVLSKRAEVENCTICSPI